jgi:hypothetical protein
MSISNLVDKLESHLNPHYTSIKQSLRIDKLTSDTYLDDIFLSKDFRKQQLLS